MKYRVFFLSIWVLLSFVVGINPAFARPPVPEKSMKAAYLYNFLLFTAWPTSTIRKLNLCVYETNTIGQPLIDIQNRTIKETTIVIKLISDINSLAECQVVFLPDILTSQTILEITKSLEKHSVLTISDHPNATQSGVMISLFLDNNKLAFDIDYDAIKNEGIELSSKLLRLAKNVHAEENPK